MNTRSISKDGGISTFHSAVMVYKELPLEYALEMNRLIELEMKESIG